MKTIALIHPFTAEAIGMKQKDLLRFHSRPHIYALKEMKDCGYKVYIDYLTGSIWPSIIKSDNVIKRFWPINNWYKGKFRWLKEKSIIQLLYYRFVTPDISIFNVSGLGSLHTLSLAKRIKNQGKIYIAMIGGINVKLNPPMIEYYQNANSVIVHTLKQKMILKSKPEFQSTTIDVVPLGVDTDVFKPKLTDSKTIELLFVGRLVRIKQIELAISAVNDLINIYAFDNIKLNIVGPIEDYVYLQELKDLVKNAGTEKVVNFTGSKGTRELISYYRSASLLLLPSKHESFGMVTVEAMSCMTPAIALDSAWGPSEIITHLEDGVLTQKDNFTKDLLSIMSQSELIKKMSIKARKTVIEKYSLNATYESLYNSINKAQKSCT